MEDNPHDPNAVALWLEVKKFLKAERYHLGYVPASRAKYLAPKLRAGVKVSVTVTDVTGGTKEKPTRGVNVVIRY